MLLFLHAVVWILALIVLTVTALALTTSHRWWVRMWDFPRVHILVTAMAGILLAIFIGGSIWPFLVLLGCAIYQGLKIFPFTAFARPEVAFRPAAPDRTAITVVASNVEMENADHASVARMIAREDPDILLLMETDETWQLALDAQLKTYPTVVAHPLSNHYGMIFATRLTAHSAKTVFLADDETPTLLADLETPGGQQFHFIGLHPRPPVPGDDTEERDQQIKTAATLTRNSVHPVVAMGDFNDVAWSWTTTRFRHHGQFLDPRIGRGMMSSFDARRRLLRFPIDQMYVTAGIRIASFSLCEAVGSDHFPLRAVFSIDGPRRAETAAEPIAGQAPK